VEHFHATGQEVNRRHRKASGETGEPCLPSGKASDHVAVSARIWFMFTILSFECFLKSGSFPNDLHSSFERRSIKAIDVLGGKGAFDAFQ
jgi:hypothetical protein